MNHLNNAQSVIVSGSELIQYRHEILAEWQELRDCAPLCEENLQRAYKLIEKLLHLPSATLPIVATLDILEAAQSMTLVDINDDGQPELLIATQDGQLVCITDPSNYETQLGPQGRLPSNAGPVIGIEVHYNAIDQIEIPHIVTERSTSGPDNRAYEILLRGDKLEPLDRRRRAQNRVTTSVRYGDLTTWGLTGVTAVSSIQQQEYTLHCHVGYDRPYEIALDYRPFAIVHTDRQLWVGDSQEKIVCWQLHDQEMIVDLTWPKDGMDVDGRITAMALWPHENGSWLLLIATDERQFAIADSNGRCLHRWITPYVITAFAPLPKQELLWLASADNQLHLLRPIHSPLTKKPVPTLRKALALLTEDECENLIDSWLNGAYIAHAVQVLLTMLDGEYRQKAMDKLTRFSEIDVTTISPAIANAIINLVEAYILEQTKPDTLLVHNCFSLMVKHYDNASIQVQRRFDLFVARMSAHLRNRISTDQHYQWLTKARKRSDLATAKYYIDLGHADRENNYLEVALNGYAKIQLNHRQVTWTFAAQKSIRAIAALPDSSHFLLATRASELYLLDLQKKRVHNVIELHNQAIPRAICVGHLYDNVSQSIALITSHGDLYIGPADPHNCLTDLQFIDQVEDDVWSMSIIPATEGTLAQLLVSCRGGRLVRTFYDQSSQQWQSEILPPLDASWLNTVRVESLTADAPPLIFAGGSHAGTRGVLHLLALDGTPRFPPIEFSSSVLDVRTVEFDNQSQSAVAVTCDNGNLYLVQADGMRLWRYRVGRAARSLAVYDIDNDGKQEIIVGGERPDEALENRHTVMVLGRGGEIQWIIPAQAPVTHVAILHIPGQNPELLIGDLDRTLQVVAVHPPDGKKEQEVLLKAESCFDLLAARRQVSRRQLAAQWLNEIPAQLIFLQAYAFYECGRQAAKGDDEALNQLLAVNIQSSPPLMHRAYARALVHVAANAPPALTAVAQKKLIELFDMANTQREVGVAAMRAIMLMLPKKLDKDELLTWSPVLKAAGHHPHAEVQRAVLYVLRAIYPFGGAGMLHPEAWAILREIVGTSADDDSWVYEAAAGLVRDISAERWGIWVWVHLLYANLGELSLHVLHVLGRDDAPFLPDHAPSGAIRALFSLMDAPDGEMANKALTALTIELHTLHQNTNTANQHTEAEKELAEMYTLIESAAQLTSYDAWELFVSDRNGAPLRRVTELLARHESLFAKDSFRQGWQSVCGAVDVFRVSEAQAEDVRRLQTELRNQSARVSNRRQGPDSLPDTAVSPFSLALTGMLYAWNRDDGPLNARLDSLTRSAEPELVIVDMRLQRDEIRIDAFIWNPGHGIPLYEVNGSFDQAILKINALELACQQELGEFRKDITLQPQEKHLVQFRVLIAAEQQKALNLTQQTNNISGSLHVPINFLQGGRTAYKLLVHEHVVRWVSRSNLDFTSAMPRAWAKVDRRLRQILNDSAVKPALVYASPLVRDNIVQAIAGYTRYSRQPIIDWRKWLDHLYTLQQNNLYIEEGPLLAWIANQIWPQVTELKLLRPSYVQRTDFRALINDTLMPNPQIVIFNHWDRLLYNIGRRGRGWDPLDSVLPFLITTLRGANIRPIFIGNRLCETMMQTLWPQLAAECTVIYANHIDITHKENRTELENVLHNLLRSRNLKGVLTQFVPPAKIVDLINMSAGYLAFIEHILLPTLEELKQNPPARYRPLEQYLRKQVVENNFFSLVWMWFGFFERIAIVLTAHGEIPLEHRRHATVGFVLSRDYYARRPNLRPVPQPTLKADTVLGKREVLLIHSNQYYRPNDVWIRGFDWQRPSFSDLGAAGQLFTQLLTAGGGQQLLISLVESRILRTHQSRHVNLFFELDIPFYDDWIRNEEIFTTMVAAARTAQASWFPQRIAHDRRQKRRNDQATLLFPQKKPELAHRDVPISAIMNIEKHLTAQTKPLFFNLFGFAGSGQDESDVRWSSLVQVAATFTQWPVNRSNSDINSNLFKALFEAVGTLLALKAEPQRLQVETLNEQLLPWTMAEIGGQFQVLRPRVMLIALQDGDSFRRLDDLRRWVAERFEQQIADSKTRLGQKKEVLDRSVAIVFVQRYSEHLEKLASVRGIGPHFVFLNMTHLIDMALDVFPQRRLINFAFDVVGRHSFTPYHLAGSLAAGSPLFVGRGSELNTILGTLDSEDHAILGSRRIGKTSLLEQIYHRIRRKQQNGRNIPVLFIRLQDQSQVKDFYWQIKEQLKQIGLPELSMQLADNPDQNYADLYAVMQQMKERYDHPVVILMDEVDGLYLHDLHQNRESLFQFLRNQLAQANIRLCTFIMTGFRHIYLSRLRYGSVFYNFCRFHNLVGVERNDVARLVVLLKEFSLEIYEEDEVIELITQGTHAIPYYVQRLCDQLLRRMSRPERQGRHYIDINDVQAVLEADLQILLKRELWDDLDVDPLLAAIEPGKKRSTREMQMVKMRLVILTTILTLYQHKFDTGYSLASLADQNTTFTAVDALRYLNEFDLNLGKWQPDEKEIDRLLRSMTMTLALAPSEESRWAYTFPNDILPDVLFYHEREGTMDLLNELEKLQQQVRGA